MIFASFRGSGGGSRLQLVDRSSLDSCAHPFHSLCRYPPVAGKEVSIMDSIGAIEADVSSQTYM